MRPRRLLFVCTGNTCRSPMAEGFARMEAARRRLDGVEIMSAGTFAGEGYPASGPAIAAARRHGAEIGSHRARPLTADLVARADLIVGMTPAHLDAALFLRPDAQVALATGFLPPDHPLAQAPVPDPFGADDAEYERTAQVLAECTRALFDALAAGPTGSAEPAPEPK